MRITILLSNGNSEAFVGATYISYDKDFVMVRAAGQIHRFNNRYIIKVKEER